MSDRLTVPIQGAAGVEIRGLQKRYGDLQVVHGVDLKIDPGEFVVFVGPSGCGKSTLLRMVAGLEPISGGDLVIDGSRLNDVASAKRGIAMVFQSYALYPHMTVYKNLAFGLETARLPPAEVDLRVRRAAGILRIESLLQRKPRQLSGGQRQRVAIGRAIVREPRIFLFDEPLSNLDAELRVQMRVELAKLHNDLSSTMIYVTHDQIEAMTLADKIVVLNQGRIEQVGTPLDLYNHPLNHFVAGFIGSPRMNFISGTLESADPGGVEVHVGGKAIRLARSIARSARGDRVTVGVRPEHLSINPAGRVPVAELVVDVVEHLGGATLLYGRTADGQTVSVSVEGQQSVRVGSPLIAYAEPTNCHLFSADGIAL